MSGIASSADLGELIDRLMRQAAQLGAARGRAQALLRSRPDQVWRSAELLWPLFTTGAK